MLDLVKHLPLPVVIVGTAGTAGLIRIMRGQLLDELERQYVITARAKGVREGTLLFKYPVRVAINPDDQHRGLAAAHHRVRRGHRVAGAGGCPPSARCCSPPSPARTCFWRRRCCCF